MTDQGVLPDHRISALIEAGHIGASTPITDEQVQPASLDLRLGHKAYRVRASFLAGKTRTIAERLADFTMHEINLDGSAVLEKGCVYLVPLMEHFDLPANITGAASAKSSIGRLDC